MMKRFFNTLKLLSIIVIAITPACDHGSKEPEKSKETNALVFHDSSNGLPSSGLWRHGLDFYDINGDGHMDIVAPPPRMASEEYEKPFVWYGNSKGEWTGVPLDVPPDPPYNYGSISVADFNGDGIADIGLAMHVSGLKALKGTAKGKYESFSDGMPSLTEFMSRALVSTDFNNDGISDIVAVSEGRFGKNSAEPNGALVCYWEGKRWKCAPAADDEMGSQLFADQVVDGDVNGDGNRDIALASLVQYKNLIVWLGDGKGGFTPFNKGLPKENIYFSVALEDLDKDGRDDLITSIAEFGKLGSYGLRAFLSKPEGFEEISEGLPEKETYTVVSACDLDGDGTVEIIGGTAAGGLKIFSQKGNRWEEVDTAGLPIGGMKRIYGLYCIDLNGDGYKDIAVNYALGEKSGGIRVLTNASPKKD